MQELTASVRALTRVHHRYFQKFRPDDDAGLFTVKLYDQLLRLPLRSDERAQLMFYRAELLWEIGRFLDAEAGYRGVVELLPGGEYARSAAYDRVLAAKAHLDKRPSPNAEAIKRRLNPPARPVESPRVDVARCPTFSGLCLPATSEPFTVDEQRWMSAIDDYLKVIPLPSPALLALVPAASSLDFDSGREVRTAEHMLEERAAVAFDGAMLCAQRGRPDVRPRLETALELSSGGPMGRFDLLAAVLIDHVVQHEPEALLPLLERLQADRRGERIRPVLVKARTQVMAATPAVPVTTH